MIKTVIVLLNFAFKCRLVTENHVITIGKTSTQTNQLACAIDHAGNVTIFTENHRSKSFFYSQDSKETCSLIFMFVIEMGYQENILFMKTMYIMYAFIKGIIGKTNC